MELGTNVRSGIDNEYLPEFQLNPADLSVYIDKRIGFREKALQLYQKVNDRCFNLMIHPLYVRGEDGHLFFKTKEYLSDYQHLNLNEAEVNNFVKALMGFQQYTQAQGKTFLYFLIPDKKTVYPEYFPETVNVNGEISRTDQVIAALEKYNVPYFYAKEAMVTEKQFRSVNNVLYDVGHWNDNGTFVSVQSLYAILQNHYPEIQLLERSEFSMGTRLKEYLEASSFEIYEMVPVYDLLENSAVNETDRFLETAKIAYPNNYVCHYTNPECRQMPKILIFGDSYLAGLERFFINHFSEYTYIHRYNVHNQECFEYYINLVNPDIVIFENPERSMIIDLNQPTPPILEQ